MTFFSLSDLQLANVGPVLPETSLSLCQQQVENLLISDTLR